MSDPTSSGAAVPAQLLALRDRIRDATRQRPRPPRPRLADRARSRREAGHLPARPRHRVGDRQRVDHDRRGRAAPASRCRPSSTTRVRKDAKRVDAGRPEGRRRGRRPLDRRPAARPRRTWWSCCRPTHHDRAVERRERVSLGDRSHRSDARRRSSPNRERPAAASCPDADGPRLAARSGRHVPEPRLVRRLPGAGARRASGRCATGWRPSRSASSTCELPALLDAARAGVGRFLQRRSRRASPSSRMRRPASTRCSSRSGSSRATSC